MHTGCNYFCESLGSILHSKFVGSGPGASLKSAVRKYDSVFATLFKDRKEPQEYLLKYVLVGLASIHNGTDHSTAAATIVTAAAFPETDPLVDVLKGLYNVYALAGSTISIGIQIQEPRQKHLNRWTCNIMIFLLMYKRT